MLSSKFQIVSQPVPHSSVTEYLLSAHYIASVYHSYHGYHNYRLHFKTSMLVLRRTFEEQLGSGLTGIFRKGGGRGAGGVTIIRVQDTTMRSFQKRISVVSEENYRSRNGNIIIN